MPFHVVETGDGKYNVENADTGEVKNKEPYVSRAKAQAYSNALNAHTSDKRGMRNNAADRAAIRSIRELAMRIHDHTMAMEPTDSDEEATETDNSPGEEAGEAPATPMAAIGSMGATDARDAIQETFGKGRGSATGVSADGTPIVDLTGEGWAKAWYEALKRDQDPNVGGGTDRDKIPAEDFAGRDRSFPIVTPGDVSDAASSIGRAGSGNYPADKIKANIIRIAKRKGAAFVAQLPKAWRDGEGKSLDLSYMKSLGLALLPQQLAVKYVGRDEIRGYTMIWGDPDRTDVEREYFTKGTDFWDGRIGGPRPLTWDHAQDAEMKADPLIGMINEFGDDDLGRWYAAKLDRAHRYRKMIDKLIEQGILGTSSDSAPQYVERQRTGKSTWLKRWPWFASALTDVPCEPRLIGSLEVLKSLGVNVPDMPTGVTDAAWAWESERIQLAKIRHTGGNK